MSEFKNLSNGSHFLLDFTIIVDKWIQVSTFLSEVFMRENLLADSFIRKAFLFSMILFLCCSAYLNSIYFNYLQEQDAWRALGEGGILMMSHTHVKGADNPYRFRMGDCSTQVNLSETGRAQARKVGQRFRSNGVDVGIVLHSRWCRARETATLAFPGMTFAESSFDSFILRPENKSFYINKAKNIISNWKSTNVLVLMTHPENILGVTGLNLIPGEALVLKNNIEVVGKIKF